MSFPTARTLAATAAALAVTGTAAAVPFTLSTPLGGATTAYGQSFVPSLGATPDPGLAPSDSVFLETFGFTSGGDGVGSTSTLLAVLPAAFFDFSGGLTAADAVGVSTNTVDTTSAVYGTAYDFEFGGLELSYTDDAPYSAVFVTDDGAGNLTPLGVSVAFVGFEESSPGVFTPITNLGGTGNFDVTALFGPPSGTGFLGGATDAQDLAITATFDTVPEPASLALVALGGVALLGRRRG
ncbi:PEP-CTERM sorting domain-containing protein [Phycisphaera mikurensis]|uniref:Ice-binding protein C-terminal domain-containing protein n=1 Tax=Phycisphaera mikurensis (strain NBRC 102666 / KCTC 22515 / FYK2301M01) TaxID=1142394 RepID=I0ID10_PHYMF|nr:PEP-CTERM sorting domain-containing protein [Phycisphaera mikurensis]MBB6442274.1 hypothetical protein [Phycisphaera mikurensis]BAM03148.1 hypothetical protein PSMK_09890 [Phycisphaera mikurensis NBRC 102666]